MNKNGYNNLAVSISIRELQTNGLIDVGSESDINGNFETYFRITGRGQNWIIDNEDKLSLKIEDSEESVQIDEDIPF